MRAFVILAFMFLVACDTTNSGASPDAGSGSGSGSDDPLAGTEELDVPVPATGSAYVQLGTPAIVDPSQGWDLAFSGYSIYTDSGVSGSGMGGAFGPLDLSAFTDGPGEIPFITADVNGGAFLDWYAYDGTTHILYSRYHVYGVESDSRLFKVQVLTYYGLDAGTPTSALYQIRYAEITSGSGATTTTNVDGTAGGLSAPDDAPSGCIDLASGTISMLEVADAEASTAWDLCFRRDAISVNGETGGPRGDGAVDLEAAQSAGETLAQVEAETADSEQPLFDGAGSAAFAGATFRGDHVVSAFETGGWIDPSQTPPALVPDLAWLVVDASGQHQYLIAFTAFEGPTTSSPGTVVMHIKPVSGGSSS